MASDATHNNWQSVAEVFWLVAFLLLVDGITSLKWVILLALILGDKEDKCVNAVFTTAARTEMRRGNFVKDE